MNQEEILVKMGMDTASIDRASMSLLERQKLNAQQYIATWNEALKKHEVIAVGSAEKIKNEVLAIERQQNDASIAMARATAAEKAAVNKAFFEEQAAQAAIGRGSGGFSWRGEGEAAAGGEAKTVGKAAVKGLEEAGKESHGMATVMRETMVLIREGLRGNFTRMIGSATILIQAMGVFASVLGGLAVTLPLIIYTAYKWQETKAAQAAAKQSGKDVEDRSRHAATDLNKDISDLEKHGMVSGTQAEHWRDQLNDPSKSEYEKVMAVQGQVNKYMPAGWRNKIQSDADGIKKADAARAKEQAELDRMNGKQKSTFDLEKDIAEKREWLGKITKQINDMESNHQQNTLAYHEALEKKVRYQLELQGDLTEQKKQQADLDKKAAEAKKANEEAGKEYMRQQISGAMDEAEFPGMEQIAGRRYMRYLNNLYGERVVGRGRRRRVIRGQFDLESGDGPFAGTAQDYELAKRQQLWDREHGNMADADADRQRMINDRDYLVKSGVASPEQMLSKIADNGTKLHDLFNALVASGALKTTVIGTD